MNAYARGLRVAGDRDLARMEGRLSRFLFGAPKDVRDPGAFRKLALAALLAWVGFGADGLSSSAYGPDESFRALGEHTGLAFFLALATAATVFILSYGYSRIIEQFPAGGGGYVVASRLLTPEVGAISGAALLIDYVLTITISIASGSDAIFSFLPIEWHSLKLPMAFAAVLALMLMNARGVKESVNALLPIFVAFVLTHALLLTVAIGGHLGSIGRVASEVHTSVSQTAGALGTFGAIKLFVRAYSMGGGTYTGIEAVSNGVGMMREPRVQTAKRTMLLMASSLAITAGGILLAYLLMHAHPAPGKTMNAVLLERTLGGLPFGGALVVVTLLSEGALLFVAAQTGFIDGPRVMANMATDSWLPHRFAALSDRLSMRNGVLIMATAALAALTYTRGNVSKLVVMYSINVFMSFTLSNLAMSRFWIRKRAEHAAWARHLPVHLLALTLSFTILVITVLEKFTEGGWVTLSATALLLAVCFAIRRHYRLVSAALRRLEVELPSAPEEGDAQPTPHVSGFVQGQTEGLLEHHGADDPDPRKPIAILLVRGYSGLGRHALLTLLRMFPNHFKGVVFLSVAVVDSESFKGTDEIHALEERTKQELLAYERYARSLEVRASSAFSKGTEVPDEAERVAPALMARYPRGLFVAGQLIFEEDNWRNRTLHNETAFMVQKRLQHIGVPMVVVPVRLDLRQRRTFPAPERTA